MVEKREEGLLVNLILFVRKPQLGKVKTRLAKDIGDEKALKIYERLLQYTFDVINGLSLKVHVFYADQMDSNDLWHNLAANYYYQEGNDLGERMMNAFKKVFSSSNNPTIIIGSDCPELKKEDVLEAIELLKSNTTVIGPAKDGGYYLVILFGVLKVFFHLALIKSMRPDYQLEC